MLWLWLVRLLNSHSIEGGGTQPLVSIEGTCLVLSSVCCFLVSLCHRPRHFTLVDVVCISDNRCISF